MACLILLFGDSGMSFSVLCDFILGNFLSSEIYSVFLWRALVFVSTKYLKTQHLVMVSGEACWDAIPGPDKEWLLAYG